MLPWPRACSTKYFLPQKPRTPCRLIARLEGRTAHKRYACDLVEILHATTKIMDTSKHGNSQEYLRKILKPVQTLDIYGALLEAFSSNAPAINHFVYAFLRRVAQCPLEGASRCPLTPSTRRLLEVHPTHRSLRTQA